MPSGCVSPSRTSSGVETSIVADAGSEAVLSALLKAVPKTPGRCSSARAARKKSRSFFQRRSHVPRSRRFFFDPQGRLRFVRTNSSNNAQRQ